ncbi:MAG TPA: glycosyltransferase family 39 protein, partial [Thermomicrobiales bacterium]|nr:glycosyltransferase family 39 protein [Thermomicrobiales bacterium]
MDDSVTSRQGSRRRWIGWIAPGNAARPFLIVLVLVVFTFSLWQNTNGIAVSKFHPDESRWINRAHYIKDLLHPTSDAWADDYLIRGQPPMGSYMIGIGLLLQGRDVSTNNPWDFNHGDENNITWNAIYGNMPAHDDLMAARRMNSVLGALTIVFTFLIITWLTNWIGGLVGALFLAINPLQTYLSSMALSDAFLTFDIALAAVVIMLLARRPSWPKAILLGILLGFGASDKLTPLFLSFGLAAFGLLLLADPYLRRAPGLGRAWRAISHTEAGKVRRISWLLLS